MALSDIDIELIKKERLNLLSLGSFCGIGVGIIIGTGLPFFLWNFLIGFGVLAFGIFTVIKNIYLLLK